MAQTIGLFTYLRLKVRVTLLRLVLRVSFIKARNERLQFTRKSTQLEIPSRDRNRSILANLYLPPNAQLNPTSPLPVLINWHGSGFVLPGHGADAFFCARMAETAGIAVLDADYRKGPEHVFPAAVNDAEDALRWVIGNPQRFDQDRILLGGFSAGANLALVTSISSTAKHELNHGIRGVVAFYPPTDLSIPVEDRYPPNSKFPRATRLYRLACECYIPPLVDRKDPRLSPMYADVDEFPSYMMFVTCDGDELCLEAEAHAKKLDTGSRVVTHTRVEDVRHGFDKVCQPGSREEKLRDEVYASVASTIEDIASVS